MVGIAGVLIFLSMRGGGSFCVIHRRLQIFIYNFKIVFDDGLLQMACWGLIFAVRGGCACKAL